MSLVSDRDYSLPENDFIAHQSVISDVEASAPISAENPPAVILASAGYDHTIRFWDVVQGNCIGTLQHNESQANCLALSRDKLLVAVGGNPAIRLFDTISATKTNEQIPNTTANILPIHVFEGHKSNVLALGFQVDSKWLWSASEDGELIIWDLHGEFVCQQEFSVGPLTAAVLHPNQEEIIVSDDTGRIRIWRIKSGECLYEVKLDPKVAVRNVSISPDGILVAAIDHRGALHLWRLGSFIDGEDECPHKLTLITSINAHSNYGIKCIFSPDSTTILTTSADTSAKLWRIPGTLFGDNGGKNNGGGAAVLQLLQHFLGHAKWVWDCAFSADSAYIITASSDESIRLWDVQSGATIAVYAGHSKAITCVALNDLPII